MRALTSAAQALRALNESSSRDESFQATIMNTANSRRDECAGERRTEGSTAIRTWLLGTSERSSHLGVRRELPSCEASSLPHAGAVANQLPPLARRLIVAALVHRELHLVYCLGDAEEQRYHRYCGWLHRYACPFAVNNCLHRQ